MNESSNDCLAACSALDKSVYAVATAVIPILSFPNNPIESHAPFNPPPSDVKNFPNFPLDAEAALPASAKPALNAEKNLIILPLSDFLATSNVSAMVFISFPLSRSRPTADSLTKND